MDSKAIKKAMFDPKAAAGKRMKAMRNVGKGLAAFGAALGIMNIVMTFLPKQPSAVE